MSYRRVAVFTKETEKRRVITINVSKKDIDIISRLLKRGAYRSRSEFYRLGGRLLLFCEQGLIRVSNKHCLTCNYVNKKPIKSNMRYNWRLPK